MNPLKALVHALGHTYTRAFLRREYETQQFRWVNESPIMYSFVFKWLARCGPVTVLDVGTGNSALPSLMRTSGCVVTATDHRGVYWSKGVFNRHFHIVDDDITDSHLTGPFDFITCISVLQHCPNHASALRSIRRLVRPDGHVALTFPYNDRRFVEDVYRLPEAGYGKTNPYACQVLSRNEVDGWLKTGGWKVVEQEFWDVFTGELWTFGERLRPPRQVQRHEKHHLTCLLLQAPEGT